MPILGYLLTWTTYGTWLPGDARGWVKKGTPGIRTADVERAAEAEAAMAETAVVLTADQRKIVKDTISEHYRRGWVLHAVNARTNHVHAVVTTERDPSAIMNQLKAWCSRKLSDDAGLTTPVAKRAGRRHWFTEGGDKEKIEDEEHLANALRYVLEGQEKRSEPAARAKGEL